MEQHARRRARDAHGLERLRPRQRQEHRLGHEAHRLLYARQVRERRLHGGVPGDPHRPRRLEGGLPVLGRDGWILVCGASC